jgi:hypothetical protein
LAHFSVIVCENVIRVGIDSYETVCLYRKASFFFYFTFGALRYALSDFHDPARECPSSAVSPLVQEHVAFVIGHDGGGPWH